MDLLLPGFYIWKADVTIDTFITKYKFHMSTTTQGSHFMSTRKATTGFVLSLAFVPHVGFPS